MTTERITDDLNRLVSLLPAELQDSLASTESRDQLLEVVLDLGRVPEARYSGWSTALGSSSVTHADLQAMVERLGQFGSDNRAGIERTLHRISAIRNRRGEVPPAFGKPMRIKPHQTFGCKIFSFTCTHAALPTVPSAHQSNI